MVLGGLEWKIENGECYTIAAEQSAVEVENHEPFGAKWSMFCRLKVRSYVLAANVAGTLKVAPLQILKFPVVLPHKFLDAEKFNLRFSDASEITEIADKLRWYRYQKGLRQRDAADYAGIDRSTYIHYGTFIRRSIWRSWRSCLMYRLRICWMTIKRLYGGCCQLCGENAFREFNADISEAHHIAYFSDSQNNDSSNIIILCPNHHRLIHKLNPKFDYNRGCFVFSENSELRIELDFHLMK